MNARERYAAWRRMFAADKEMADQLAAIETDAGEVEDRFYCDLSFGTAGMRGVLGAGTNRMNRYNVRRATLGLADLILSTPNGAWRGVAIAYDSRRKSAEFAKEAALTLCSCGVRVMLYPQLQPVPILSFTLRHLHAQSGIVITASHNPPQYNGYKVYWEDGGQMPPERADEVYKNMLRHGYDEAQPMEEELALSKGLLSYIGEDVLDIYTKKVLGLSVQPELARTMGDRLTIVYSPLNGSGNMPVRRVLRELGMRKVFVVAEQENPDPDFMTVGTPNPENLGVYDIARKVALKKEADLIFATDPDCDRLGCLVRNETGEFLVLTGNQIGCLLLDYLLSGKARQNALPANGAVVKSIVSTQMANAIAAAYGVACFDVLTGFKFIAEKIEEFENGSHTFLFGFEESYGYLSGTFVRDKDAVNASLLLAEAAAFHLSEGRTLYQALRACYEKYGYYIDRTLSFTFEGKDGLEKIASVMAGLRDAPPEKIGGIRIVAARDYKTGVITGQNGEHPTDMPQSDVLYYDLEDDAWVCIRPSGTEPKVKLYIGCRADVEAEAETLADRLANGGKALVDG